MLILEMIINFRNTGSRLRASQFCSGDLFEFVVFQWTLQGINRLRSNSRAWAISSHIEHFSRCQWNVAEVVANVGDHLNSVFSACVRSVFGASAILKQLQIVARRGRLFRGHSAVSKARRDQLNGTHSAEQCKQTFPRAREYNV